MHCWKSRSACFISLVVLDSVFHLWEVTDPETIEFTEEDVFEFAELWNRSQEGKSASVGEMGFPNFCNQGEQEMPLQET